MENKKYTHYLICGSCYKKFSIESPEAQNTKIKLEKIFCPSCGKKNVQLDMSIITGAGSSVESIETRRRRNADLSNQARQDARRYAGDLPREEMVTIQPPKGDTKDKKPEQVPKRVLESIKNKINPDTL